MQTANPLAAALRDWAEVFMRRSMRDMIRYTRTTGYTMPQISTLMRISKEGVCGVSNIGDYLGVTNAAASQMINKLVDNGLLERSEDPDDRRNRLISLTPAGNELVQDFIDARYAWLQGLSAQLSAEDQAEIIDALHCLNEAAVRLEPVEAGTYSSS